MSLVCVFSLSFHSPRLALDRRTQSDWPNRSVPRTAPALFDLSSLVLELCGKWTLLLLETLPSQHLNSIPFRSVQVPIATLSLYSPLIYRSEDHPAWDNKQLYSLTYSRWMDGHYYHDS
jgi:hypothetical protein